MKRIAIIGGGISGLAAANRILELSSEKNIPVEIKLFEATHHLGGVISTTLKEGFLLEGGPDSFISEKPAALELCRRIGLEHEIIGTREEFRKSFVMRNGRLLPVPEGFYMMAPMRVKPFLESGIFSWPGKIRMAMEYFIPPRANGNDESVAGFIRRRFGNEALERVGQAMIAGIYSSDPEKLSLQATFPRFLEMEKKYGSVIRGLRHRSGNSESKASGPRYSLFLSLKNGMQTLITALAKRLSQNTIELDAQVRGVIWDAGKECWLVSHGRGGLMEADAVVFAVSTPKMAELIAPVDSALSVELQQIQYSTVATLNLAYRNSFIQNPVKGFGFVVPARERMHMIGCTFSNMKFAGRAPEGFTLMRAFVGGALAGDMMDWNRAQIESTVKNELEKLLGIQGAPLFTVLDRHVQSMPQYHVGHLDRVERIEAMTAKHDGLYLTGNAFRGIGIPDCVKHAEQTAEKIVLGGS